MARRYRAGGEQFLRKRGVAGGERALHQFAAHIDALRVLFENPAQIVGGDGVVLLFQCLLAGYGFAREQPYHSERSRQDDRNEDPARRQFDPTPWLSAGR